MPEQAMHDVDFGLSKALGTLQGLLTSGETLEAWAAQRRIYALTHRRICIAATSGRFISLSRRLLAADLTLVAQSSSDLNIASEANRVLTFAGLNKGQAQAMYRICQQHDQV